MVGRAGVVEVEQRGRIVVVAGEDQRRPDVIGARDRIIGRIESGCTIGCVVRGIEGFQGGAKSCNKLMVGRDPDAREEGQRERSAPRFEVRVKRRRWLGRRRQRCGSREGGSRTP
jgi:hypothetical protein